MLPQFFANRPIFAWVIALAILIAGVLAFPQLPISQYPEVAPPALSITASYPGASADTVESTVTKLIEQEMNGLENLLYMQSSSSSSGDTEITLTFESGTDLDIASVEAQNRIKRVEARLPEDVRRQGIQVLKARRNFLLFIALYSPEGTYDNIDLGNFAASRVLDTLRRVEGVGEAQLFGTEYAMRIWIDPLKLTRFGLTPADVLQSVRNQNVQLATGELGALPAEPGQQISATIVTRGRLSSPEEFRKILIKTLPDGSSVTVDDVAQVELGAQFYGISARRNSAPSAAVGIKLSPDGNALETAEAIRASMAEQAQFFPEDITWDIPYDTSRFVEISITEVLKTLVEAFILVFLVMWLFLGNLRAAIIPTIVVPISLIGTLAGLLAMGYSINVLSLFAMVLAIGILVDDAIVVVENVERVMHDDKLDPKAATHKAMRQIISAIIGITVVLSAVFIPMAFFGGSVGAIYREFAVTLVMTMAFSALLALTLTPALTATLLKPIDHDTERKGFLARFERGFQSVTNGYMRGVGGVLKRPIRVFLVYLVLVAAAALVFLRLPGGFLPDEDQGYFISIMQLPPGATQERTLDVLGDVENYLLEKDEVARVVGVAGFSFFGRGQNTAIAFTNLTPWDDRTGENSDAQSLVAQANQSLFGNPDALIFSINPPPIPELAAVGGFDFQLQDRGNNGRDALLAARNMLLQAAGSHPALAGVRPEGLEPAPQLRLHIDRLKASALGISLTDLNSTLQVALGSAYVNDYLRDGRVQRVIMQVSSEYRSDIDSIMQLRLRNAAGELVPLTEIATAEWVTAPPRLERYNGFPSLKLAGGPAPGYSTGDALTAMEQLAQDLPPGFSFEWSGTSYEEKVSGNQAPLLFGLSVLIVFLCLAALYESWSIPLAVLLVIPLGLLGSGLAVWLRSLPNDVYFKVGIIAIIGLAAKNAILIVEFARQLQNEGKPLREAVREACRLRFRPIVMTSLAFMLGVLPLVLSSGAGAASRHAIGTGVLGGMFAATVLAVFMVPMLYMLVRSWLGRDQL